MLTVEAFAFECVGKTDEYNDCFLALCCFAGLCNKLFVVAVAL